MADDLLAKLDDAAFSARIDPNGTHALIEELPEQCAEAWEAAQGVSLPDLSGAREAVVLGMGGSAIAGDMLRTLAQMTGDRPVHVVRGYDAPPFIDGSTLVIACSHSGNTEETLAAFEGALEAGGRPVVLTTGGALAEQARAHDAPLLLYEYAGGPRYAIGHQLMRLLAAGERAGLIGPQADAVTEAVAVMLDLREDLGVASPAARNPAKQLAARLHGALPVIVGAGVLSDAAYRWKTQINENSKSWAVFEELPELDHNSIVGFGLPEALVPLLRVVFLTHPALHPRVLLRIDGTGDALTEAGVAHERVEAKGTSPLAQVLSAVYTGDLVSYYLALLNEAEPSSVAPIEKLKQRLARG